MKDLLNTRHKEFEKRFASIKETDAHYYNPYLKDFLSFHDQTVLMVLEKVREGIYDLEEFEMSNRDISIKGKIIEPLVGKVAVISLLTTAIESVRNEEKK